MLMLMLSLSKSSAICLESLPTEVFITEIQVDRQATISEQGGVTIYKPRRYEDPNIEEHH